VSEPADNLSRDPSPRERDLLRELAFVKRSFKQLERQATAAELAAKQSKKLLLSTNEDLLATIERHKCTEMALREAQARAEQASQAKGRFLANMSHEIRTPLNGVLGALQLLCETGLNEDQRGLIKVVQNSAEALLELIGDVLDFSKIEAGRLDLAPEPFDLRRLLEDVVVLERHAARTRGIELEWRLDRRLPRWVRGDPVRLRQVLLNLLSNAIKFTAAGRVRLSARPAARGGNQICFRVCDTGIGIEREKQELVFDSFTQADSTTTRRYGGTGLGLTICRQLCRLMGGDVRLRSKPGKGSVFSAYLDLPAIQQSESESARQAASNGPPLPTEFLGLKVLVVDDVPINRLVAQRMLASLGAKAQLAEDGSVALSRVTAEDFDVVLMDCSMPVMDGFEACRRIRTLVGARGELPIVAMTAHVLEGDAERCRAAGMDGYLAKPVRLPELVRCLRQALGREEEARRSA
jgi:signal transduction histidine kinase/ActR/RegA family two-component response regulator